MAGHRASGLHCLLLYDHHRPQRCCLSLLSTREQAKLVTSKGDNFKPSQCTDLITSVMIVPSGIFNNACAEVVSEVGSTETRCSTISLRIQNNSCVFAFYLHWMQQNVIATVARRQIIQLILDIYWIIVYVTESEHPLKYTMQKYSAIVCIYQTRLAETFDVSNGHPCKWCFSLGCSATTFCAQSAWLRGLGHLLAISSAVKPRDDESVGCARW